MANFLDSINKTINTLDSLASVETAKIDSANTVLDSLNTRPMYEQSLEKQPLLSNIYTYESPIIEDNEPIAESVGKKAKEDIISKITGLDIGGEKFKTELNEWHHQPPTDKRWSGAFSNDDSGLTEFEQQGGKDTIKEVGAGTQYRKFYKDIERQQKGLSKSVNKFKQYLEVQGLKSKARELEDHYLIDSYGWMRKWLKKFISDLM